MMRIGMIHILRRRVLNVALGLAAGISILPAEAFGQNVALNAPVTVTGPFGLWNALSPDRITNGVFNPEGTVYWDNAISWVGTGTTIEVDLQGRFGLSGFVVQADNNDSYLLEIFDGALSSTFVVPQFLLPSGGVTTRPLFSLPSTIFATELRLSALSGDNLYSISQVQAFGAPVPEPASGMLVVAGGTLLVALVRRRRTSARPLA